MANQRAKGEIEVNGRVLLTIPRACEKYGISRRTAYNWMEAGKVEWVRLPSGLRRIYEDTILRKGE